MSKGMFFVIDGGDGSGKATQTKLLVERLNAFAPPVHVVSFPRYETATGQLITAMLRDKEFGDPTKLDPKFASALFAVDRLAAAPELSAALDSGCHVVADRYVGSNMGHQGTKFHDADARAAYFTWNDKFEHGKLKLPRPDLNLILHVPAEVSMRLLEERARLENRPLDGHENLAHLKLAEQTYLEIAKSYPGFKLIECVERGELLSREAIHQRVWSEVQTALALRRAEALHATA